MGKHTPQGSPSPGASIYTPVTGNHLFKVAPEGFTSLALLLCHTGSKNPSGRRHSSKGMQVCPPEITPMCLFFFFFFCSIRVWTQVLKLARLLRPTCLKWQAWRATWIPDNHCSPLLNTFMAMPTYFLRPDHVTWPCLAPTRNLDICLYACLL
jgi:hypothetical protein